MRTARRIGIFSLALFLPALLALGQGWYLPAQSAERGSVRPPLKPEPDKKPSGERQLLQEKVTGQRSREVTGVDFIATRGRASREITGVDFLATAGRASREVAGIDLVATPGRLSREIGGADFVATQGRFSREVEGIDFVATPGRLSRGIWGVDFVDIASGGEQRQ
jgi:hypothetical protein